MNKTSSAVSKLIPFVIGISLLMEMLDTTVLNTAIPQMAQTLAIYPISLKIGITSYLLSLAAFTPISGYIADKYGSKTIFSGAIIVFLIGSIICGFATNLTILVIGRIIQGVGGAMMTPVGRLILVQLYPKSELVHAFAQLTIIGQFGVSIGPLIGGALTTFVNWRMIFFVNIPIGLFALVLISYFLKNDKKPNVATFDLYGFVLFGVSAGLITFALTLLTEQAVSTSFTILLFCIGVLLLGVYYQHARKILNPSLDIRIFSIRTFSIAVFGSLFFRISSGSIPFLLPLLFQINFGLTAFKSGLLLLPFGIAILVSKAIIKKLLIRFGYKHVLLINPIIVAMIVASLGIINHQTSYMVIMALTFLLGFFSSIQFTSMNTLNFADINAEDNSKATSISSVMQQLSTSFGVCFGAGILIIFEKLLHATMASSLFIFQLTFISLGLSGLLCLSFFACLKKTDGDELLQKKQP